MKTRQKHKNTADTPLRRNSKEHTKRGGGGRTRRHEQKPKETNIKRTRKARRKPDRKPKIQRNEHTEKAK